MSFVVTIDGPAGAGKSTTARALMASMADRGWDSDALTHWTPPPRARDAHRRLGVLREVAWTVKCAVPTQPEGSARDPGSSADAGARASADRAGAA